MNKNTLLDNVLMVLALLVTAYIIGPFIISFCHEINESWRFAIRGPF